MGKASRRKAGKHVQEAAMNILQEIGGNKNILVRENLRQEQKISHALMALLNATVPEDSSLAEKKTALDLICLAWNISLMDADEHPETLQEVGVRLVKDDETRRAELLGHLQKMIDRKRILFPSDRRTVVSWQLDLRDGYLSISAAGVHSPT
jgi:hypothetical protein